MPRKKRTELERVREARMRMVESFTVRSPEPLSAEHLRVFTDLCQAAEDSAQRDTEQVELKELAEKLQALINAHNQLSDIVDELRRPGRAASRGLRMG